MLVALEARLCSAELDIIEKRNPPIVRPRGAWLGAGVVIARSMLASPIF